MVRSKLGAVRADHMLRDGAERISRQCYAGEVFLCFPGSGTAYGLGARHPTGVGP